MVVQYTCINIIYNNNNNSIKKSPITLPQCLLKEDAFYIDNNKLTFDLTIFLNVVLKTYIVTTRNKFKKELKHKNFSIC